MAVPSSILVADGSADCADAVAMLLASNGMRVTVAYDGQRAITLGACEHFDAAVMDVAMPGASGMAVARELRRSHGTSIKLVAYTAWPPSAAHDTAGASDFDEIVLKACHPMDLLRAISPECHGALLRSMQASGEQVRLQISLAHALLDTASLQRSPVRAAELRELVGRRAGAIERSLGGLLIAEVREAVLAELAALRRRIPSGT